MAAQESHFYADQYIQLAPQGSGWGSRLFVDLDDNNYGDTGIDFDGDGKDDLSIWRPYGSYYGWYSENPVYTFRSADSSANGKYYRKEHLPSGESFNLEIINETAEKHDLQISRRCRFSLPLSVDRLQAC